MNFRVKGGRAGSGYESALVPSGRSVLLLWLRRLYQGQLVNGHRVASMTCWNNHEQVPSGHHDVVLGAPTLIVAIEYCGAFSALNN